CSDHRIQSCPLHTDLRPRCPLAGQRNVSVSRLAWRSGGNTGSAPRASLIYSAGTGLRVAADWSVRISREPLFRILRRARAGYSGGFALHAFAITAGGHLRRGPARRQSYILDARGPRGSLQPLCPGPRGRALAHAAVLCDAKMGLVDRGAVREW